MGVCGFHHRGDPDSASTGRQGGEQGGAPVAEVSLLRREGTGTQGLEVTAGWDRLAFLPGTLG